MLMFPYKTCLLYSSFFIILKQNTLKNFNFSQNVALLLKYLISLGNHILLHTNIFFFFGYMCDPDNLCHPFQSEQEDKENYFVDILAICRLLIQIQKGFETHPLPLIN